MMSLMRMGIIPHLLREPWTISSNHNYIPSVQTRYLESETPNSVLTLVRSSPPALLMSNRTSSNYGRSSPPAKVHIGGTGGRWGSQHLLIYVIYTHHHQSREDL